MSAFMFLACVPAPAIAGAYRTAIAGAFRTSRCHRRRPRGGWRAARGGAGACRHRLRPRVHAAGQGLNRCNGPPLTFGNAGLPRADRGTPHDRASTNFLRRMPASDDMIRVRAPTAEAAPRGRLVKDADQARPRYPPG